MRVLTLIFVALLGTLVLTAGSYIQPTDTRATYVFQDSLLPTVSYDGIDDTQLAGGTALAGRNYGGSTTMRVGVSSANGGVHRTLIRHNPFDQTKPGAIDSTNVASWDSITIDLTLLTVGASAPRVDTLLFRGMAERRWVQGTGLGAATAADSCGCTGTARNAQVKCGGADTTWLKFRADSNRTTLMSSLASTSVDSMISGYSLDAGYALGQLTQGLADRAPFPGARLLINQTLTPNESTQHINITNVGRPQLSRNLPLNMFVSIRFDTVGIKATCASCTQDSLVRKLDMVTGEEPTGGGGGGIAAHPKITYYVRLKRMPVVGTRMR